MKHLFRRLRHSSLAQLVIKISCTVFIFWLVFRGMDFEHMQSALEKQNHYIFFASFFFLALQTFIGAYRWRLILGTLGAAGNHAISYLVALRIYYISLFFTCCLPGAVGGDVVRVWLGKTEQLPFSILVNSVIIDRLMALVALIIMVVITLPVLGASAGFDTHLLWPILCVVVVAGIVFLYCGERLLAPVHDIRPFNWILYLLHSVKMILKNPLTCIMALFLALIGQVVYALSAWVLAQSLYINMSVVQSITLMPPVMLATTLPISIGGWGVREAGIISMLGLIGVPQASAFVLSLEMGLISILISLPASLLWLMYRRRSPNLSLSEMHSTHGKSYE